MKRCIALGVRDLVVIHPIDEIGISKELHEFANMDQFPFSVLQRHLQLSWIHAIRGGGGG